jgi:ubiquinone/menaquinone biosynthesis C-methylase UbiE
MDHQDHVNLLRRGIPVPGGVWADLGSGHGAFTLALADCLGSQGEIYSIDRDGGALKRQQQTMQARFPAMNVHYLMVDFTQLLHLPALDGIVMANSLHFLREKGAALQLIHSYLKPGGRLIVVEYNVYRGNLWVPHPFSFRTWQALAQSYGFTQPQQLAVRPSRFLREIYSAVCFPVEESRQPAG